MKTTELKVNEMEQASGGNFFEDVKNVLKKIFPDPRKPIIPDPFEPGHPVIPTLPEPMIARGKC